MRSRNIFVRYYRSKVVHTVVPLEECGGGRGAVEVEGCVEGEEGCITSPVISPTRG